MVRQSDTAALTTLRRSSPARRSLNAPRDVASAGNIRVAGIAGGTLLALFVAAILIPAEPMVAGIRLTPYTMLLLIFGLPLVLRYLQDPSNRVTALDVFVVLYVAWMGLAILAHYGTGRAVFVVNQTISLIGGYLIGRVLVRTAADYRRLFVYLFWALVVLFPVALVEFVIHRALVLELLGAVVPVHQIVTHTRLGFYRVQGVFENPILFGLFCSLAIANFYYVFEHGRRVRTALAVVMTFMSISSAATISMGLQLGLILWDRVTGFLRMRGRWLVLVTAGLASLAVVQLASQGGMIGFVVENLTFDSDTGWGRTEIFEYGAAEVTRNPLFGIGLDEWVRPWWRKGSVDNFWLLTAMRYGLPALLLLWAGLAAHAVAVMRQRGLSETAVRYRTGYLVAGAGLVFMLATVHAWGAVSIFIMTYLGAGVWFYAGGAGEDGRTPPRGRPSGRRPGRAPTETRR